MTSSSINSLYSFTIASVASDVSLHMNGFAVLLSDILRDAIELPSFAVFSHKRNYLSFAGVLNIAVNINGGAKVLVCR